MIHERELDEIEQKQPTARLINKPSGEGRLSAEILQFLFDKQGKYQHEIFADAPPEFENQIMKKSRASRASKKSANEGQLGDLGTTEEKALNNLLTSGEPDKRMLIGVAGGDSNFVLSFNSKRAAGGEEDEEEDDEEEEDDIQMRKGFRSYDINNIKHRQN